MVTPVQIKRLQKQIWNEGFPPLETKLLKEWQLTDRDILWLRILSGCIAVPARPVTVTAMIQNLIEMTEKYQFCQCQCTE